MRQSLGLKQPQFQTCLNSEAARAVVMRDVQEAKDLELTAHQLSSSMGNWCAGAIGFDDFKAIIERELSTKAALVLSTPISSEKEGL